MILVSKVLILVQFFPIRWLSGTVCFLSGKEYFLVQYNQLFMESSNCDTLQGKTHPVTLHNHKVVLLGVHDSVQQPLEVLNLQFPREKMQLFV